MFRCIYYRKKIFKSIQFLTGFDRFLADFKGESLYFKVSPLLFKKSERQDFFVGLFLMFFDGWGYKNGKLP